MKDLYFNEAPLSRCIRQVFFDMTLTSMNYGAMNRVVSDPYELRVILRRGVVRKLGGLIVGLILLAFSLPSWAEDFSGKVVGVTDGDSIEVLRGTTPVKIRLNGIDCPESHQGYGQKAKEFTSEAVFGKNVTVKDFGLDKYGRTLGEVTLPDGKILNQEIVRAGLAWWYWKYSQDKVLGSIEVEARASRAGLWSDSNAVPPWLFRRGQEEIKDVGSAEPASQPIQLSSPVVSSPSVPESRVQQQEVVVYVTRTGKKYHREGCTSLAKSKIPVSLTEAVSRGYGPCSICRPPTK